MLNLGRQSQAVEHVAAGKRLMYAALESLHLFVYIAVRPYWFLDRSEGINLQGQTKVEVVTPVPARVWCKGDFPGVGYLTIDVVKLKSIQTMLVLLLKCDTIVRGILYSMTFCAQSSG